MIAMGVLRDLNSADEIVLDIDERKETKTVTFKIDPDLLEKIDQDMKRRNIRSRSDYLRWIITYNILRLKNQQGQSNK
ncbi:MAG: ribbon-helix-helix domain-containing protein [Metallosphaera sp.]